MKECKHGVGYGSRSQGVCPFDVPDGTCRICPKSVAVFGNSKSAAGKDDVTKNDTSGKAQAKKRKAGMKKRKPGFIRKHRVLRFFFFLWQDFLNIHWVVSERLSSFSRGKQNYYLRDGLYAYDRGSLISLTENVLKEPTPQVLRQAIHQVIDCNPLHEIDIEKISTPADMSEVLLLMSHYYAHAAACVSCVLGSKRIPLKQIQNEVLTGLPKSNKALPCIECIELGLNCQSHNAEEGEDV